MTKSGGNESVKKVKYFFKKRTRREWTEITRMKLRQYEMIGKEIIGKPSRSGRDW